MKRAHILAYSNFMKCRFIKLYTHTHRRKKMRAQFSKQSAQEQMLQKRLKSADEKGS